MQLSVMILLVQQYRNTFILLNTNATWVFVDLTMPAKIYAITELIIELWDLAYGLH